MDTTILKILDADLRKVGELHAEALVRAKPQDERMDIVASYAATVNKHGISYHQRMVTILRAAKSTMASNQPFVVKARTQALVCIYCPNHKRHHYTRVETNLCSLATILVDLYKVPVVDTTTCDRSELPFEEFTSGDSVPLDQVIAGLTPFGAVVYNYRRHTKLN